MKIFFWSLGVLDKWGYKSGISMKEHLIHLIYRQDVLTNKSKEPHKDRRDS